MVKVGSIQVLKRELKKNGAIWPDISVADFTFQKGNGENGAFILIGKRSLRPAGGLCNEILPHAQSDFPPFADLD